MSRYKKTPVQSPSNTASATKLTLCRLLSPSSGNSFVVMLYIAIRKKDRPGIFRERIKLLEYGNDIQFQPAFQLGFYVLSEHPGQQTISKSGIIRIFQIEVSEHRNPSVQGDDNNLVLDKINVLPSGARRKGLFVDIVVNFQDSLSQSTGSVYAQRHPVYSMYCRNGADFVYSSASESIASRIRAELSAASSIRLS